MVHQRKQETEKLRPTRLAIGSRYTLGPTAMSTAQTAAPFPINQAVLNSRARLAKVADRHATMAIPDAVINRAEEDAVMTPTRADWCKVPYGVNGKILVAAREIREVASRIIVARDSMTISEAALSQSERELDEVEEAVALLRDQLNAAREDRFDAEDARRSSGKVADLESVA